MVEVADSSETQMQNMQLPVKMQEEARTSDAARFFPALDNG